METNDTMKLLTKLHSIMSEVGSIEKDATNDFHKYKYASEHAIKSKIQPLLIKHKVLFHITIDDSQKEGTLTTIACTYSFTDIETGQALTGKFKGSGLDTGDKGMYKALTGAIKYILTSTFLIPTGDDPEVDNKAPEKPTAVVRPVQAPTTAVDPNLASAAQIKYIFKLASMQGMDAEQYKETIKETYGLTSFNELTKVQASEIIDGFQK